MYGQGNFPPPYHHPSQLTEPNQKGQTGPQSSNPPYPAHTSHSYPNPHTEQPYTQPLPQQIPHVPQLYQSHNTPPPSFLPASPPSQFGHLSTNPTNTMPVPIPTLPTPAVLPPTPSLPPPSIPPPPPDIAPKPSGEEVLPGRERLDSSSCTNLEKENTGSVSPALSDMDMEDDDVPASNQEANQYKRETPWKPSLENKESNVDEELLHQSYSTIKENVEPLHGCKSITKEHGEEADVLVNAHSPKPLPATGDNNMPFMEDLSPARSSLEPAVSVIDANNTSKTLEENRNISPFQLLQQDYGSLDSGEDADRPTTDKEIENADKDNIKHKAKDIDASELNEVKNGKRLPSESPGESPRKRIKAPLTDSFPAQPTGMPLLGPHPPHFSAVNTGPISTQDPSQPMWTHLPPPPPPPMAPHMQLMHNPLHSVSDFTANLGGPYPPVEPPQTFPLPFPSHAERWPRPSVSAAPLNLPPGITSSTVTGVVASTSTLLPSFTGSTITTRYNPYASTFETIPPPPVFSISSKLPGEGLSTNYSTKYGTVKHSTSGTPYDPLSDSIEPIKKSDPLPVPDQLSSKPTTEQEADDLGEEVVGAVENISPEPVANPGPSGTGTSTATKEMNKEESRSMKLLKVALADYVKEVLKPAWRQGNISKDAFKTIVKKTVDKVSASVPSHHIPKTTSKINQYVEASQQKVTKLVMSYVDKYVKKQL